VAYNSTTWSEDTSTKASETTSVALNNASLSGSLTVTGGITTTGASQFDSTLTVGVNDTGHDVKFFGATSGQYMLWDESADELVLVGDSKLSFHDAAGGENIIATSNGHLEINAGTTLDITAPTVDINASTLVQVDGPISVGVDDTGYDVKFFGATSGSFMLWDESDDALELTDSSPIKIGDGGDMTIYHDGSHSYVTNATGTLKLATETSGIAVSIGHTTSETTVNDNLTVTGTLTAPNLTGDVAIVGDLTISGGNIINAITCNSTVATAGLLTATSGVKLGNNIIYASDGGSTITMDTSDNVTIAGDLTVTGNNISGSGGSIITFSGDDVQLADNLQLNTDSSKISFGVNSDVQLIHIHDEGLRYYANSAATDAVVDLIQLSHNTTGTAADGIGIGIKFTNEDDAGNLSHIGNFDCIMTDASNGSENSDFSWRLYTDGSENERMRLTDAGNLSIVGDLTVTGADVIIGADADGTDRTITFSHSTLKSIMGIDDSADRFVINTDASFDGTIADNDFSIDASGNAYVKGDLTVTGNNISGSGGSIITFSGDDVQLADNLQLNTNLSGIKFGANTEVSLVHKEAQGLYLVATSAATDAVVDMLDLQHLTSGTAADGIGIGIKFQNEDDGGSTSHIGNFDCIMTDASADSENSDFSWKLFEDGTEGEKMRLTSNGALSVAGNFACNGRTTAARPNYTVTNGLMDRSYDANSTSTAELADVLSSVISDLISIGLFQ